MRKKGLLNCEEEILFNCGENIRFKNKVDRSDLLFDARSFFEEEEKFLVLLNQELIERKESELLNF